MKAYSNLNFSLVTIGSTANNPIRFRSFKPDHRFNVRLGFSPPESHHPLSRRLRLLLDTLVTDLFKKVRYFSCLRFDCPTAPFAQTTS